MGKRVLLLLLALMLALPSGGLAAHGKGLRSQLEDRTVALESERIAGEILAFLSQDGKMPKNGLRVGNLFFHPLGFAFRIPAQYEFSGRFRGTDVTLVDRSRENTSFSTTISLTVAEKGGEMDKVTEEQIKSAYGSTFRRFELVSFAQEELFGCEGIRLLYRYNDTQPLLVQQLMFSKNGKRFFVTLMMQDDFRVGCEGLERFSDFCDSLHFMEMDERK